MDVVFVLFFIKQCNHSNTNETECTGKRRTVVMLGMAAFRRKKQTGLCIFKVSLVYKLSSRSVKAVT